jgi:hypothetical protein
VRQRCSPREGLPGARGRHAFCQVMVQLPRFQCAACDTIRVGINRPTHCRSTPELNRLQLRLSALTTYRTAADVLEQMFPIGTGTDKETMRWYAWRARVSVEDKMILDQLMARWGITKFNMNPSRASFEELEPLADKT